MAGKKNRGSKSRKNVPKFGDKSSSQLKTTPNLELLSGNDKTLSGSGSSIDNREQRVHQREILILRKDQYIAEVSSDIPISSSHNDRKGKKIQSTKKEEHLIPGMSLDKVSAVLTLDSLPISSSFSEEPATFVVGLQAVPNKSMPVDLNKCSQGVRSIAESNQVPVLRETMGLIDSFALGNDNNMLINNKSPIRENLEVPKVNKSNVSAVTDTGIISQSTILVQPPGNRPNKSADLSQQLSADKTTHTSTNDNNSWNKRRYFDLSLYKTSNVSFISQDGSVTLDEESINLMSKQYEFTLVGRIIGKFFPFYWLQKQLNLKWGNINGFKVLDLGEECFALQFHSLEDRDSVWLGGPWHVAGYPVGLDIWTSKFRSSKHAKMHVPTWIRLPSLPLGCFGITNLFRIVSTAGEPLCTDEETSNRTRTTFARVCVRCDYSKPLKTGTLITYQASSFFQEFKYEGIHLMCTLCGIVGHASLECKMNQQVTSATTPEAPVVTPIEYTLAEKLKEILLSTPAASEIYKERGLGPWNIIPRRKFQKKHNTNKKAGHKCESSSPSENIIGKAWDNTNQIFDSKKTVDELSNSIWRRNSVVSGKQKIHSAVSPDNETHNNKSFALFQNMDGSNQQPSTENSKRKSKIHIQSS